MGFATSVIWAGLVTAAKEQRGELERLVTGLLVMLLSLLRQWSVAKYSLVNEKVMGLVLFVDLGLRILCRIEQKLLVIRFYLEDAEP